MSSIFESVTIPGSINAPGLQSIQQSFGLCYLKNTSIKLAGLFSYATNSVKIVVKEDIFNKR